MSRCRRTMWCESDGAAGWRAVKLKTVDPKSVHSANGRLLVALRCQLLMLVSSLIFKPLLFWYPCRWQYINVETFNLLLKMKYGTNTKSYSFTSGS